MGRNPQETAQIARRRQHVAALYIKGWFQAAIAEELGISQTTVCHDIRAVYKQWRESSIRDFDAMRERELRKLDLLEREAWAAWERSQQPAESTKVTQDGSGKVAQKTVQKQSGNPRYLEQVQKCIAARRALLGVDAPTRIAPVMPDGEEPFRLAVANLGLDELRALKHLRDRVMTVTPEQEHGADEPSSDDDPRVD